MCNVPNTTWQAAPFFMCAAPQEQGTHARACAPRQSSRGFWKQAATGRRARARGRTGGGTGSHAVTLTRASQQRPPTTPASHPPVPLAVSAPSAAGWWMERAAAEGRSRCSACDSVRGRVVLGRASCVRVGVHEPMQNVSCVALSTRAARARAICVGFHGRA
jgi:hypothetical protein